METVCYHSIGRLKAVLKEAEHVARLRNWRNPHVQLQLQHQQSSTSQEVWFLFEGGSSPDDPNYFPRVLQV